MPRKKGKKTEFDLLGPSMKRCISTIHAQHKAVKISPYHKRKIPGHLRVAAYKRIVVSALKEYDDWCKDELKHMNVL